MKLKKLVSFIGGLVFLGMSCLSPVQAANIPAISCNNNAGQTHLQDAIDTSESNSDARNTIIVPAGTCTLSIPVSKTLTKHLKIIGADGPAPAQGAGISNTIIQDNTTNAHTIFSLVFAPGKTYDISGITWSQGTSTFDADQGSKVAFTSTNTTTFRIHNMTWTANPYSGKSLGINTCAYGLVDHVTMVQSHQSGASSASNGVSSSNNDCNNLGTSNTPGVGDGYGHYMFTLPNMINTPKCLFIEDSIFSDAAIRDIAHGFPNNNFNGVVVSAMNDGDRGSCQIVRHNLIHNLFVQGHDTMGEDRGMRYLEVYNNTFDFTNGYVSADHWGFIRSGAAYAHDNTIAAGYGGFSLLNERQTGVAENWGQCNGTSPYDMPGGYRCLDQIGNGGSGILYSGYPGTATSQCTGQPGCGQGATPKSSHNQVASPSQFWNNGDVTHKANSSYSTIQENRDFFNCNQTSGCTVPVGYVTYIYPHPLTSTVGVVWTAATCNPSDIQSLINNANVLAGDTIVIPTGACSWTTQVSSLNKMLTFTGALPCTRAVVQGRSDIATGCPLQITLASAAVYPAFVLIANNDAGIPWGLSEIEFIDQATPASNISGHINFASFSHSFRIHHTKVTSPKTSFLEPGNDPTRNAGGYTGRAGDAWGVIDHNQFGNPGDIVHTHFLECNHPDWAGVLGWGDNSWHTPPTYGTQQGIYLEDNVFYDDNNIGAGFTDAGYGCRKVIRFNYIPFDASHGTESGQRFRGQRSVEYYGNRFVSQIFGNGPQNTAVLVRSGGGFFGFNSLGCHNGICGNGPGQFSYTSGVTLQNFRDWDNYGWWWNGSSTTPGACDGRGGFDTNINGLYFTGTAQSGSSGNHLVSAVTINQDLSHGFSIINITQNWASTISSNTLGVNAQINSFPSVFGNLHAWTVGDTFEVRQAYPCIDQPGRGSGVLLSGNDPVGPVAPVNEASEPFYAFANVADAGALLSNWAGGDGAHVQEDRDYFQQKTSFNCLSGTGTGTKAQMLALSGCTNGVAFWVTNEGNWNTTVPANTSGVLYIYNGGWPATPSFVPLTYPHPLIGQVTLSSPTTPTTHTYATHFSSNENPISEGGMWIGGKTAGIAWSDFQSISGVAYGLQDGTDTFNDDIALLTGTWGADQTVQATIKAVNPNNNCCQELELRLRSTINPNSSTGYEINWGLHNDGNGYLQVVAWQGPFGSFRMVTTTGTSTGPLINAHDGDTIRASIVGSTITVWINNVQMLTATDTQFTSGNPGIGAFQATQTIGTNGDYGFRSVVATDGQIINAATCSQADVAAAVALARTGDIVLLPDGTCTWTQRVSFPNVCFTLMAKNGPTLDSNGRPVSHNVTIVDGTTYNTSTSGLLDWNTSSNGICRISGINWLGCVGCPVAFAPQTVFRISGNSHSYREDHNTFTSKNVSWHNFSGWVYGVIDHNNCHEEAGYCGYIYHDQVNNDPNGCAGTVTNGCGDSSWAAPDDFGTANALYTEDNLYDRGAVTSAGQASAAWDGWSGMRRVDRFNTLIDVKFDGHGTDSTTRSRSFRLTEIYGNTFTTSFTFMTYMMMWRGGTGLLFNNSVTDPGGFFQNPMSLVAYRVSDCTEGTSPGNNAACEAPWWRGQPISVNLTSSANVATGTTSSLHYINTALADVWVRITGTGGNYDGIFKVTSVPTSTTFTYTCLTTCGAPAVGTASSAWDFDATMYPKIDQVGRGQGNLIGATQNGANPLPAQWPNQAVSPIYNWNNTKNGGFCAGMGATSCDETYGSGGITSDPIKENRDFFMQHSTTFTGSPAIGVNNSGIGVGARGSRPPTPTTLNVAWWSTDQGGDWNTKNGTTNDGCLDVWNGSAWVNCKYIPFTYPHPLITATSGGGGSPPPPPPPTAPSKPTGLMIGTNYEQHDLVSALH